MGLRMLLLLHALIPCLGAYNIVPSFPVLLHIYTTLVSLLFGTVIPTSFNILMEMFLLPCIVYIANGLCLTILKCVVIHFDLSHSVYRFTLHSYIYNNIPSSLSVATALADDGLLLDIKHS